MENSAALTRRGIAWFLGLSFVPAWTFWLTAWIAGHPLSDPVIQVVGAAFLPAAAAIVVRRWITRQGFADAGLRPRFRQSWRWYLAAMAVPYALLAIAISCAVVSGVASTSAADGSPLPLGPLVMVIAAPIFLGEEFGWTAYLRQACGRLPVFRSRPTAAAAFTGTVWGVWHWPLASVGYFGFQPPARDVLLLLLLWVVISMLLEVVWSALWNYSGSVWPTSIAHAGFNLVFASTMSALLTSDQLLATFLLPIAALVPIVLAVLGAEWRRRSMFDTCNVESWESRPSSVSPAPFTDTVD